MTVKRDSRGRLRDYKKEYDRDHKPSDDKKDRVCRAQARRKVNEWRKKHKKAILTSKQTVDHKDGNPCNNKMSNLKVVSQGENSTKSNKARAKKG